jgi:hypothetical protein
MKANWITASKAGVQGHLMILPAWGPLFMPGAGSGARFRGHGRVCVLVVMDACPAAAGVEQFLEAEPVEVLGP